MGEVCMGPVAHLRNGSVPDPSQVFGIVTGCDLHINLLNSAACLARQVSGSVNGEPHVGLVSCV